MGANEIFKRAVYRLYLNFIGRLPTPDEVEEYTSEAWVRWLATTDPAERANPALAAKRAVAAAWQRDRRYHAARLEFVRNPPRHWGQRDGLPDEIRGELERRLLALRKKQGERGRRAARRDVAILNLIAQGYSDEGIALEIGATYASVRTYRKHLKNSLKSILEGLTTPPESDRIGQVRTPISPLEG